MAVKGRGESVNRTRLSEIFGISMPTVDAWVRQGCPVIKKGVGKGDPTLFNTADVANWLAAKKAEEMAGTAPTDETELKRRKLAAETGKAELEFAIARGDVAPVREFERVQAAMNAVVRQNVMNVPQRVVLQLLGETDESRFKQVLIAELKLALETAAEAEIDVGDDEETEE